MSICAEYLELASARSDLYGFFARVYRIEADDGFLKSIGEFPLPDAGDEGAFSEGVARLHAYLRHPGIDPRTDLAVDYARVFLGAGIADDSAAFPYESVYTSPERLVMQEARDRVVALYRAKGLAVEGDGGDPEDHVAFELDFMAHLVREGAAAARVCDEEALRTSLREQRSFLDNHLLNWVPALCVDIEKYASKPFYPAIAKMTCGYMDMDAALLEDFLNGTSMDRDVDERRG